MTLDQYPSLDPADGEVIDHEVYFSEDLLVKVFALGPGATVSTHVHDTQTNVFHILEGKITVLQSDTESVVEAPGIVVHDRGVPHGARNDEAETAVFTATMGPMS